jgi:hypothetical protein
MRSLGELFGRGFQLIKSKKSLRLRVFCFVYHAGTGTIRVLDDTTLQGVLVDHYEMTGPEVHFILRAQHTRVKHKEVQMPYGNYISRRPSMAFSMVTSSVYSMSLPTGSPIAILVTRIPCRFNCWAR